MWLASWMGNLIAYLLQNIGRGTFGGVIWPCQPRCFRACEGVGLHRGGVQACHENTIGGELHLREGHTNTTKGGLIRLVHVPSESSFERRRTWGHSLDDGGQLLFKNLF